MVSEKNVDDIHDIINSNPDTELKITIRKPIGNFEQLTRWVNDVLEISPETTAIPCEDKSIVTFLNCVLRLSVTLQNAVGVPTFKIPMVTEVTDLDDSIEVKLIQYRLSGFMSETFTGSLQHAISICHKSLTTEPTDNNILSLMSHIESKVIPDIRIMVAYANATVPIIKAAGERGIPFVCLGKGIYQLGTGSSQRRIRGSMSDRDSSIGLDIAGDKFVASSTLRNMGFPTPEHHMALNLEHALGIVEDFGYPVVVKPVDADRGEGVTINVDNDDMLRGAVQKAMNASISKVLLIEKPVEGVCHRLFITNGKMVYSVKRDPIYVVGNGVDTIVSLNEKEKTRQDKRPVWNREPFAHFDYTTELHLNLMGMDGQTIPSDGEVVHLRAIESTQDGGIDEDMTKEIHPDNIDMAIRATKVLGLDIAGVDIIGKDLSVPWHKSDMVINDINPSPTFCAASISRSYLPEFIDTYFEGDCCIPIIREGEQDKLEEGTRYAVLSGEEVTWSDGRKWYNKGTHQEQLRMLLLDPTLDALVIV